MRQGGIALAVGTLGAQSETGPQLSPRTRLSVPPVEAQASAGSLSSTFTDGEPPLALEGFSATMRMP